ncbi:hypothetical protein DI392_15965 [Vibrio albus]|uniref:Uncharacterized protein n=1 Tax=Vibrio albus TaxID=2200953 RepID=A0A2U3B5V0_9VIBR|nr:hypothetical protein [Vibrio albus]PWI32176.1 hypothetical protein DI392_15965 [Vibrio albus]
MPVEIEIYLPCRPEAVCDVINGVIALLFVIGVLMFIRVICKEYDQIKHKNNIRQKKKTNRKR